MKDAKISPNGILAGGTTVRASIAGVHMNTNVYCRAGARGQARRAPAAAAASLTIAAS